MNMLGPVNLNFVVKFVYTPLRPILYCRSLLTKIATSFTLVQNLIFKKTLDSLALNWFNGTKSNDDLMI